MAWLTGFAHRFKFTIDNTLIDSTLTDFPVVIRIHAQSGKDNADLTEIFDNLGSESLKIAVTTSDGETQCYVEIEHWDLANENAVLHAKIPSISDSADTVFYLYYDKDASDNSTYVGVTGSTPAQSVWDSDFEAVYHLSQDPSGGADAVKDSTANARHLTSVGTMTTGDLVDGLQGAKSIDFEGTDDGLYDNAAPLTVTPYTLEGVAKRTDSGAYTIVGIVDKDVANHMFGIAFRNDGGAGSDDVVSSWGYTSGEGWVPNLGSTLTSADTYYHVAGVYTDGTDREVFMNGVSDGTDATSLSAPSNIDRICVGYLGDSTPGSFMKGNISEARISSAARSDAWIKATYYTLFDKLATASVRDDWVPGFANRIKVTIDSDLVDAALSDFPVLLRLASGAGIGAKDLTRIFTIVGSDDNRKKIAVTTSDGITQCPVEIDFWDTENQVANLWTKVPSVSNSADTDLYFYFDGSVEDNIENVGDTGDAAAQEVWDDDFEAVWHLSQDPSGGAGCMLDSTANEVNGTPAGSMASDDLVDMDKVKGQNLDGTDDQIGYTGPTDFSGNEEITVEALFDADSNDDNCLMTQDDGTGTSSDLFNLYIESSQLRFGLRTDAAGWEECVISWNDPGVEYYCAGKKPTGTDYSTLWINDGTSQDDSTNTFDMRTTAGTAGNIGVQTGNGARDFNGRIGEIRLSSVARSDAWLKATYHTLFDTLITWGDYEQREFKKYRKFTIDADNIDGTLTDFPLAIPLSTSAGVGAEDLSDFFAELAYPAEDEFLTPQSGAYDTTRWELTGQSANVTNTADALNCLADSGDVDGERQGILSLFKLDYNYDFDVQVDFEITAGAATNGWSTMLEAYFFDQAGGAVGGGPSWGTGLITRRRYDNTNGHSFEGICYENGTPKTIQRDSASSGDTTGKLRIVYDQSAVQLTAYYDKGAGWVAHGTFSLTDVDAQHAKICINVYTTGSKPTVTANFTNFKINSGVVIWPDGEPNRKKIKVTAGDLVTQCYAEIDHLDCGNQVGMLHAKIPSISSSVDTEIYLHYDADQPDNDDYVGDVGDAAAQNVWDEYFEAVYHLNEDPTGGAGCILDSTANGNDLTPGGSMTAGDLVDAHPGKGIDLDGSNDHLTITSCPISAYPFTLEAAGPATVTGSTNTCPAVALADNSSTTAIFALNIYDGYARSAHSTSYNAQGTDLLTEGVFCHIAGRHNGAADHDVFTNGGNKTNNTDSYSFPAGLDRMTVGGPQDSTPGYRAGEVSEVRVSSVARSDAWIKATYMCLVDTIGTWDTEPGGAWFRSWASRYKFTVDKDNIDGLLTNFPIAMAINSSAGIGDDDISGILSTIATADRLKIAVTDRSGLNQLFVEIEQWDSTGSKAFIHVKAPEVFFNRDTEFFLYYDSNEDDNTDWVGDTGDTPAAAVWDKNFVGVWHMAQDPSGGADCMLDSTANANHGTPGGTMTVDDLIDGSQAGKAIDFDGTDDVINCGSDATLDDVMPMFFEAIFNADGYGLTGYGRLAEKSSSGSVGGFDIFLRATADENISVIFRASTTDGHWQLPTSSIAVDTDYYFGFHLDRTTAPASVTDPVMYLNGSAPSVTEITTPAGSWETDAAQDLRIGDRNAADRAFDGEISEIRISDTDRGAAWAHATYYALFDALGTWGDQEGGVAGEDVNAEVSAVVLEYTPQAAAVGVGALVTTPIIEYTPLAAGIGMGVAVSAVQLEYLIKTITTIQNFYAIGIMSKPIVTGSGPSATATGRQPGASASGAGPGASVTGKGE